MTNEPPPAGEPAPSLQFDKAEFVEGAGLKCAFCQAPIDGQYFQINAQPACPNCRAQVDTDLAKGTRLSRPIAAFTAGSVAAVLGFLLYWGIGALTGYEFGLIAIVVGWGVGAAVRWGSNARGGWLYQLMAVALTYASICATYTPDVMRGMAEGGNDAPAPVLAVVAFIFSLAVPFLTNVSNLLGNAILAFGVYQAWVMNRKPKIEISGPFNVEASPAAPTAQAAPIVLPPAQ